MEYEEFNSPKQLDELITNNGRYSVLNVNDIKIIEKEMKENSHIFLPYLCVEHTEESLKTYNGFLRKYHKQHKYCPKCGATEHTSTLVGYILNWNKKEEYKDMNICKCMKCGDTHKVHDRIEIFN